MFGLFKKKVIVKTVLLHSICDGQVVAIDAVPDKIFAQRMLGDGIGFTFEGDTLYAPCDAEVVMIADTKHAIGIKAANGAELLIHIGLDTVNLRGKGFSLKVRQGDMIKQGQPLVEIDRAFMAENHMNLTTPMVMTSHDGYTLEIMKHVGAVHVGDVVLRIEQV